MYRSNFRPFCPAVSGFGIYCSAPCDDFSAFLACFLLSFPGMHGFRGPEGGEIHLGEGHAAEHCRCAGDVPVLAECGSAQKRGEFRGSGPLPKRDVPLFGRAIHSVVADSVCPQFRGRAASVVAQIRECSSGS